jgi:type I restriction enzyme S subunit
MTMSLVVEHFDDLLSTPEDVEQLNRTILQLAVQGKLVSQDLHDEPAIEALNRILKQKEEQILPTIDEGAKVFELPASWQWTNLGFLSENIHYGYTASADFDSKDYRLLRITDIQDSRVDWKSVPGCQITENDAKKYLLGNGDILIARTGGTIGKSFLVADINVKAVFASYLIRVLPSKEVMPEFLKVFLDSPLYWRQLVEKSKGTGQPNVNATSLSQLVFGLPPLAEQQRIVARVEELFAQTRALAKELAHSQSELDGLNKSALSHLLASETPEEFNQHWEFIAEHFDLLFQTPEHVAPLRQSILELAVRGKLTRREVGDEAARELLKRISEEKEKLGKTESMPAPLDSERYFPLPNGWEWARMTDICQRITDGFHNTPKTVDHGVPYVLATHVKSEGIDFENCFYVSEKDHKELYAKTNVKRGDILVVNIGAGSGTPAIVDVDFEFSFKNTAILKLNKFVDTMFLFYFLLSIKSEMFEEITKGGAQPFISLKLLRNVMVPFPPLAEQERIVKRVEQLLSLCDALEARLQSAEEERGRLVAAVMSTVGG